MLERIAEGIIAVLLTLLIAWMVFALVMAVLAGVGVTPLGR